MANKVTKQAQFEAIKARVADNPEMVAFIDHEIELLVKKNSYKSTKPTKTQVANEGLKVRIAEVMADGKPYTASEVLKALGDEELSGSKVTAMLTQMKNDGKVVRTEDKRKAYFTLA